MVASCPLTTSPVQCIVQILQETCVESLKSSSKHLTHIEIPNTLCRTADQYSAMGTQQQFSSSSSHGHGSNPTEGEGPTLPKSVGGISTSNVLQGVAGAQ